MSDSTDPAGGGSGSRSGGSAPGVPETGASNPTEAALDATAVFEEGEDFDLRPGADSCTSARRVT